MSKLPNTSITVGNSDGTVETVISKEEASFELDRIIERNMELEEIFAAIQPLLATLSEAIPSNRPLLVATKGS